MKAIIEKKDNGYFIYLYGSNGLCDIFAVEHIDITTPIQLS